MVIEVEEEAAAIGPAGDDGSGGWTGTAVVSNAQPQARSTNLTFTILAAGQPVATILGPHG